MNGRIYKANFLPKDLFELSQNRANLYKTFIDRGLKIDGTINPQFAIPEMATVFEKLEKEFLLLRRAVNMNPEGVKDFFESFGFTDTDDIKKVSLGFTENINSLSKFYNTVLTKIKTNGWNGLEYMDLMKFYTGFYASLNFNDITTMNMLPDDKNRFFNELSIYTVRADGTSPFNQLISNTESLLKTGQISLISDQNLKEFTPFLTHMAVPIYNVELPDVFMRGFDGITTYSYGHIRHDAITHLGTITRLQTFSSVSQYLLDIQKMNIKPSLEGMKSVIKSKLNLNLIEIKKINIILSKLSQENRNVFYAFMFHYFHEDFMSGHNFTHNKYSLGKSFKKYLNSLGSTLSADFPSNINRYGITQSEVDHFARTLDSIEKETPNIFESTSDVIVRAFTKYLKNK